MTVFISFHCLDSLYTIESSKSSFVHNQWIQIYDVPSHLIFESYMYTFVFFPSLKSFNLIQVCPSTFVLYYDCPDIVIKQRLVESGEGNDETEMNKQLEEFHSKITPLLLKYQEKLKVVSSFEFPSFVIIFLRHIVGQQCRSKNINEFMCHVFLLLHLVVVAVIVYLFICALLYFF